MYSATRRNTGVLRNSAQNGWIAPLGGHLGLTVPPPGSTLAVALRISSTVRGVCLPAMRIVLISPRGPLYRHRTGIWKKSLRYAPLTLTTLASLVPPELNADVAIV